MREIVRRPAPATNVTHISYDNSPRESMSPPPDFRLWNPRLALGLALALCACGGPEPVMGPDGVLRGHGGRGVLVVAVDSLRADHMNFAGYDRDTTPVVDGMLKSGVAFTQTFSASPDLIPSHASLLTGCDPYVIRQPLPENPGAVNFTHRWRVPDPAPSLAAEFLAAGYATACFMDNNTLLPELGLARGFERFDKYQGGATVDETDLGASRLGRRALDWVRSLDEDRDWFAYIHVNDLERSLTRSDERWNTYFDPRPELDEVPPVLASHRGYFGIPERLFPGGHQTVGEYEASYDGFIRQMDNRLGRLMGALDSAGRLDQTTVCLTGTYGVGFGESGLYLDHGSLSDVDLHVPWVIQWAKSAQLPRGELCTSLASLTDVAPTLLELAGIPLPEGLHGVSQLPALRNPAGSPLREFTFAQGGINSGFAVHDARYSFQATIQAAFGDKLLQESWYGQRENPRMRLRRHLLDRSAGTGPGDMQPSATDPERANDLLEAGEAWYELMEQARIALHKPTWLKEKLDEQVLVELKQQGLISSEVKR